MNNLNLKRPFFNIHNREYQLNKLKLPCLVKINLKHLHIALTITIISEFYNFPFISKFSFNIYTSINLTSQSTKNYSDIKDNSFDSNVKL